MKKKKTAHKKPDQSESLQGLAQAVGNFIRYWGFRRIHGQLWTQIFLSDRPLSGAELIRRLNVSKALVSPALGELQAFKLIECLELDGRTYVYKANPDVFSVIRSILKERETKLVRDAKERFQSLLRSNTNEHDGLINSDRLKALGEMIEVADFAINFIVESADSDALSNWFHLRDALRESQRS